jgi:hypothetical protein
MDSGAPINLQTGQPLPVCGLAGNSACPPEGGPNLSVFYSTCTPTAGMGTFRVINLSPSYGPLTFQVEASSTTIGSFTLDDLQASSCPPQVCYQP